ncbi:(E)-4-hydroxy-3-methylbut-2-enyl-diphosphate synthase [Prevotella communis]|uniref:(E)-4-hydroxy-3-methylbut-2-enyl-diphosphate synthase n=1 Tax=Prevotella communis TaxID=2913614 RepID=UPI001EDA8A9E|nr:(E)-4-hydroxy-3-methylbut-2-enyl-diphosphate synthase [Prevotella communis]UKK67166.1 (E)-4-hydroxy-3-methylbut-2-enyl-diphosphate synthase [Prevotella communis]UKK70695.1 (E)-4-hydroxy-3-methylbut-2-enyl-diphosphate synthase [Prevotella communis]
MSTRRISSVTHVGKVAIGGDNPIRVQSMATTDTNDTEGSVAQAKRIIDAGGELVRFTTQGIREAENMKNISARLKADGYDTPLVADVHFTAHTADVAAQYCEKVRINPGNYVDPGRTFKHLEYTDEEYAEELKKIDAKLVPFINICKEHHTAVRIGVNHGSLSDRIMSRYGDTPEGIVESCMEFLRIFRRENFNDVVISIKASNTVVMVTTVRLLVKTMDAEEMHYPLHLGVTEAGEGEDGRVKSALGIGALLTEGIGDTIRVSLSEEPECEIPVARKLVELIPECTRLRAEAEASIKNDTITLDVDAPDWETLQLKAAMAVGALLIDRKATKLVITSPAGYTSPARLVSLADAILQAARIKFTKTEYISCPGCGRTLYNLQETIAKIKAATSHLVGLKIGIMGCIVNGPGEMADADYGYVGAGRGKISLYKGKQCVEKNIPEEEAVDHLLSLIQNDRK